MTETKLDQPPAPLEKSKEGAVDTNPLNTASITARGFRGELLRENLGTISQETLKLIQGMGENEMKQQQLGDLSNANITIAGHNAELYMAQSSASGYEAGEKRLVEQADLLARENVFRELNNKAASAAGDYVAYGGMPGGMDVPAKPTSQTGHAMSGYLDGGFRGSSVSSKANYFSDPASGFFANVARIFESLRSNYGPSAIGAAYQSWTPFSAVMQALKVSLEFVRSGGGLWDAHLHGGGMNGNEIYQRTMAKKADDDKSGPA